MARIHSILGRKPGTKTAFSQPPFWANQITLNGLAPGVEDIENDFQAYVEEVYKQNGVVFACMATRMLVFSEARFQWQQMEKGRPGKLFGDKQLELLEKPWPSGSLPTLLKQVEADGQLAGNGYVTHTCDETLNGRAIYGKAAKNRKTTRLVRMFPDRVDIILWAPDGNPNSLSTRIAGFKYKSGVGRNQNGDGGATDVLLLADEVAHYAPYPDPQARYRGMSWITPVLRDIGADNAATDHKKNFFAKGATIGHVVSFHEETSQEDFDEFVAKFKASHQGFENAYETLFLGGGADVKSIGTDLQQLEFSQTQGHGETKIAAASGVPPVIVGLSEGLQAATYSNYGQARRRFADGTLRPLWRDCAAALEVLFDTPAGCRLWYDDRDIAFLREDRKDVADILQLNAMTIKALIDSGWEPDSAVDAVAGEDMAILRGHHTGLTSVQLQPPKTAEDIAAENEPKNPPAPTGGVPQEEEQA